MHHCLQALRGSKTAGGASLVNQPAIVLADEPTGALDTKTGEQIMDLLTKLNRRKNHYHGFTHTNQKLRLLLIVALSVVME